MNFHIFTINIMYGLTDNYCSPETILRHCQTLQERARDDASGLAKAFRST